MEYTSIIPMREIQRNYAELIQRARHQGRPLILGSHGKARAVLMDIGSFQRLTRQSSTQQTVQWKTVSDLLKRITKRGKQNISLSDFIRHDRGSH